MLNIEKLCFNCFHEKDDIGVCPYCGYYNLENTSKFPGAMKEGSILNGQYIVGRVLGQGGFGITYLALDYQLELKVAIKEYLPEGMATRLPGTTRVTVYEGERQNNFQYGAERFLDEARVLAKFIGNKNIVSVKSYFRENNTAYFVMDYIEGINFKIYIKNHGGHIGYEDVIRILIPVMDALALVHREGVIHRDVTPDNIYITKDNEIKLLDFGSARYSLGDKSKCLDVILKAGYAPKEQYIAKGKQGPYTDVYSLAACFYASITGYLPQEALERLEKDELIPISARGFQIPKAMEFAIMKGLALRSEDRYQNMEDFKTALFTATISIPALASNTISSPTQIPNSVPYTSPNSVPQAVQNQVMNTAPSVLIDSKSEISQVALSTPIITTDKTLHNPKTSEGRVVYNEPSGNNHVPTADKTKNLNKRVIAILSAVACILILLIVTVVFVLNSRKDEAVYTNSGSTGSTGGSNYATEDILTNKSQVKEQEPIAITIDCDLEEFNSEISDIVTNVQVPVNVKQTNSKEEFESLIQKNYKDSIRSISFGYINEDILHDATTNGAIVKESSIIEGIYYIIFGVEDILATNIIDALRPAEEGVAEKIVADKATTDKAAAEKAAADKAAADKAAADKAAADKAAADKAAAEKAAADKAAADKAKEANKCSFCNGTGKVECTWCDGTGACKIAHQGKDEYIYEGNPCLKSTTCTWCDGTGKK